MSHSNVDVMSPIPYSHSSFASTAMARGHKTHSRGASPIAGGPSRGGSRHRDSSPQHGDSANTSSVSLRLQQEELSAIQDEIEQLKQRRRMLENQRQELKYGIAAKRAASASGGRSASNPRQMYADGGATPRGRRYDEQLTYSDHQMVSRRTPRRSQSSQSRSGSTYIDPILGPSSRPIDHCTFIPSERERRALLSRTPNPYRDMKERMKKSWAADSTLVGGYFALNDNPHTGSFGRARRFDNIPGSSHYYLSTDVQKMQRQAKSGDRNHYSVANRGKSGCNVNSHWNDSKGGGAPGPGAYTPRYQKLAPPSRLAKSRQ